MIANPTSITWMVICCGLLLLLQPGFCCLESGLSNAKNSINVALKNFADFVVACLIFALLSYGLIFGQSYMGFVGYSSFFDDKTNPANAVHFLYQMLFCGMAATIVSGAVAERGSFKGYLVATAVLVALIYPLPAHWLWNSSGFLFKMGAHDFAGATVVHATGGLVALALVLIIGPRHRRFAKSQEKPVYESFPTAVLGVFLIWVGWFGINGGASLELSLDTPRIILNTMLGGIGGGFVAMLVLVLRPNLIRLPVTLNAGIAGLVITTAGADIISPQSAILMGMIGGIACIATDQLLIKLKIDDGIGAVSTHLPAAILGMILTPFFALELALNELGGLNSLLLAQVTAITVCCVYVFGISYTIFSIINRIIPLRVSPADEVRGLNQSEHGVTAATQSIGSGTSNSSISFASLFADNNDNAALDENSEVGHLNSKYKQVMLEFKKHLEDWRGKFAQLEAANGILRTRTSDLEAALAGKEAELDLSAQYVEEVSRDLASSLEESELMNDERLRVLDNITTLSVDPLNKILGAAKELRRDRSITQGSTVINKVMFESSELSRLLGSIQQLLHLKQHPLIEESVFDLNTITSDIVLRLTDRTKAISFDTHLASEPLTIRADLNLITTLIEQLLLSSTKRAMGRKVQISLQNRGGERIIQVTDKGRVLSKEQTEALLDPIAAIQGEGAEILGRIGFGVGLVKEIIELHEGTLAAITLPREQGMQFTVTFPRSRSEIVSPAA